MPQFSNKNEWAINRHNMNESQNNDPNRKHPYDIRLHCMVPFI